MRIVCHKSTCSICPPEFAWSAYDDNTYDGEGSTIGTGATEAEAIEDLCEQLDLDPAEFLPHEPEARA